MISIGIDSGSRMTKICLFDISSKRVIYYYSEETKDDFEANIERMINKVLDINNISDSKIKYIISTGYGRKNYSKSSFISSEIICHAKGVLHQNSSIKTIIDIGGQDSKIIKISNDGKIIDFLMNDKCAAGTGRFLEKVAGFFNISLDELSKIKSVSDNIIEISSTCVVFAESEMIGFVNRGVKKEDIINAVCTSIIHRIISMSGNIGLEYPLAFVGGVAKNSGMVTTLNKHLNHSVYVPDKPEFTGALGAALQYK